MKIVHICFGGIFTDGFSYQENLLSKYHVKLGYEVTLITSELIFNNKGQVEKSARYNYENDDGVHIIRLKLQKNSKYTNKLKRCKGLYEAIKKEKPDIIFVHCPQFLEMPDLVKYAKENYAIKIYVDNHADFSNSGRNFVSKYILHGILWKHMVRIIEPYTTKFYGVLPARVDFLTNIYKLPCEKCRLLVMGGDDELIKVANSKKVKDSILERYNVEKKDFLVVTGGKIDKFKKQTLLLMKAVKKLSLKNVKLLVFGSVDSDMKAEFDSLCDEASVQYIGWIDSSDSYKYFAVADLVVFPGRHSVFWEQVVAQRRPMICKYWEGTTHVDIGGNVKFLKKDSEDEIIKIIDKLADKTKEYNYMFNSANSERSSEFLYSEIAKKSIEIN